MQSMFSMWAVAANQAEPRTSRTEYEMHPTPHQRSLALAVNHFVRTFIILY